MATVGSCIVLVLAGCTDGGLGVDVSLEVEGERRHGLGDKGPIDELVLLVSAWMLESHANISVRPWKPSVAVSGSTMLSSLEIFLASFTNWKGSGWEENIDWVIESRWSEPERVCVFLLGYELAGRHHDRESGFLMELTNFVLVMSIVNQNLAKLLLIIDWIRLLLLS
jgi:hypothetical protein